jgi:hypothetical protein
LSARDRLPTARLPRPAHPLLPALLAAHHRLLAVSPLPAPPPRLAVPRPAQTHTTSPRATAMPTYPTAPWENLTAAQKQRSKPLLKHMALRIHDARRDKTGQVDHFFASELKLLAAKLHMTLFVSPEKHWPKMQAVAWAFYVLQLRATRRAHEELTAAAAEAAAVEAAAAEAAAAAAETQRLAEEAAAADRAEAKRKAEARDASLAVNAKTLEQRSKRRKIRAAALQTAAAATAAATRVTRSAASNSVGSKKRARTLLVRRNPAVLACSYCGATDFLNKQALGGHVRICPSRGGSTAARSGAGCPNCGCYGKAAAFTLNQHFAGGARCNADYRNSSVAVCSVCKETGTCGPEHVYHANMASFVKHVVKHHPAAPWARQLLDNSLVECERCKKLFTGSDLAAHRLRCTPAAPNTYRCNSCALAHMESKYQQVQHPYLFGSAEELAAHQGSGTCFVYTGGTGVKQTFYPQAVPTHEAVEPGAACACAVCKPPNKRQPKRSKKAANKRRLGPPIVLSINTT